MCSKRVERGADHHRVKPQDHPRITMDTSVTRGSQAGSRARQSLQAQALKCLSSSHHLPVPFSSSPHRHDSQDMSLNQRAKRQSGSLPPSTGQSPNSLHGLVSACQSSGALCTALLSCAPAPFSTSHLPFTPSLITEILPAFPTSFHRHFLKGLSS